MALLFSVLLTIFPLQIASRNSLAFTSVRIFLTIPIDFEGMQCLEASKVKSSKFWTNSFSRKDNSSAEKFRLSFNDRTSFESKISSSLILSSLYFGAKVSI